MDYPEIDATEVEVDVGEDVVDGMLHIVVYQRAFHKPLFKMRISKELLFDTLAAFMRKGGA